MSDLRERIAAVLYGNLRRQQRIDRPDRFLDWIDTSELADAVIEALDLANPCATTGCQMRQIARRHAEASSELEMKHE
jgi:hypothetical protein